jgi:hypothetical protein
MVIMGSKVQSKTHKKEATLEIWRRRANILEDDSSLSSCTGGVAPLITFLVVEEGDDKKRGELVNFLFLLGMMAVATFLAFFVLPPRGAKAVGVANAKVACMEASNIKKTPMRRMEKTVAVIMELTRCSSIPQSTTLTIAEHSHSQQLEEERVKSEEQKIDG